VINICRYAQRLTGVGKLHAVIGGFHLTGPLFEPTIADTVSALEQLAPDPLASRYASSVAVAGARRRQLGEVVEGDVPDDFDDELGREFGGGVV